MIKTLAFSLLLIAASLQSCSYSQSATVCDNIAALTSIAVSSLCKNMMTPNTLQAFEMNKAYPLPEILFLNDTLSTSFQITSNQLYRITFLSKKIPSTVLVLEVSPALVAQRSALSQ